MMRRMLIGGLASLAVVAGSVEAQGRGNSSGRVPPGHLPGPGQCRVWIDGVPPGHQPAPTDCATAERTRPSNGRVIYGSSARRDDDRRDDDRRDDRDGRWDRDGRRDRDDRDRRDRDDDGRYGRDRDRDGRRDRDEDDREYRRDDRRDGCIDRNGDRRCDVTPVGYPDRDRDRYPDRYPDRGGWDPRARSDFPSMIVTRLGEDSPRAALQRRWLGRTDVRSTYLDTNRDRRPDRVLWRDRSGERVQVWHDTDRDGRADVVEEYRDGRLVRTVR